jgi:hypothetical protein
MTYKTNVDILNNFFGLDLQGWYRGDYRSKTNPNRIVWFPKLDYIKQGKRVTGDPDWSNHFMDNSNEILITKPVHPEKHIAIIKLEDCYWDTNVEMALFARTRSSQGKWEGRFYGIYCFFEGNKNTGERKYKRINKKINPNTAAEWLN